MPKKFWINNKNHFLQYFDGYGNLSSEQVYDGMIQAGAFSKMQQIVKENTKFNCAEYLVQLEASSLSKLCLKFV